MTTIDLAFIQAEAIRRKDDYEAFAYYVELDDRSDVALDALVDAIAEPIIAAIDCTKCANCCRSLDVFLTPNDAERLSPVSFISLDQVLDHQAGQAVGEWAKFTHQPCIFLNDKRCTIYDHRPDSCRMYPIFTPQFRWTVRDILSGVGLCPIIYHVIEDLQAVLDW